MDIYIPSESKEVFLSLERNDGVEKNYNLLFNKYIKWFSNKIDKERIKNLKNHNFNELLNNIKEIKKSFKIFGYESVVLEGKIDGKLIVGLGGTHVAETSIMLHHIYGIPYIPGSALKGVTRYYCLKELFEEAEEGNDREQILCFEKIIGEKISKIKEELKDEKKFEQKYKAGGKTFENIINWFNNDKNEGKIEEFQNIFGTQDTEGKVIFMDSYPEKFDFKIDIMNPHYSNYYSGKTPPVDYLNPVPIFFLVLENSTFIINLFSKNGELLKKAVEKVKKALTTYGIGAKTSLGYGMFQKVEEKDSK